MDISAILIKNFPNAVWTLDGDEYSGLTWVSPGTKPTKKSLEDMWAQVSIDLQIETVRRARQKAYTNTSDSIFFKYQAGEATKEEWLAARSLVESNNPYPTE
jgi:hypothetical protein